jgi:hypothetical protein
VALRELGVVMDGGNRGLAADAGEEQTQRDQANSFHPWRYRPCLRTV